ncbi:putative ESX-3 secretion system protein [Mycobacterium tuberculosis]|nr:putative ESX-3 secretion system protein [Mycobacterium tuberculosis]
MHTVELVGAGNGGVATRVALAAGTGYFTQTVGGGPDAPGAGSLFWVSDTGVRYGTTMSLREWLEAAKRLRPLA